MRALYKTLGAFTMLCISAQAFCASSVQSNPCEDSKPRVTAYGSLTMSVCSNGKGVMSDTLKLDGRAIISDIQLFREDFSSDWSKIVYTSATQDKKTGCPAHLFIVDISTKPVTVIGFGVKNGCNQFHWASWGKRRSVIALDTNVEFKYENGKLTPPKADEYLDANMRPTMFDLSKEKLQPFIEYISPAK